MNGAIEIEFESGPEYVILPIHEYRASGPVFRVEDTAGTHLLSAADVRGSWNAWVGELICNDQIVSAPPAGITIY